MSEKVKKHRKRKFLLWAGALLLAVALGLTFLFACSSSVDRESIRPADSKNILLVPPTDGSTPADYSALDNVGYIIGRLSMLLSGRRAEGACGRVPLPVVTSSAEGSASKVKTVRPPRFFTRFGER